MPIKISGLEEKTIERTDHLVVAEGDVSNKKVLADFLPITDNTEKTVASPTTVDPENYDFADFHTAMKWVVNSTPSDNTKYVLRLDDGVHLAFPVYENKTDLYYIKNRDIMFISKNYNKSSCSITFGDPDVADWVSMFYLFGSYISFNYITINATLNGATPYNKHLINASKTSSNISLYEVDILDFYCITTHNGGSFYYLYGNVTNCNDYIFNIWAGNLGFKNVNFIDCAGICFDLSSSLCNFASCTFTNCNKVFEQSEQSYVSTNDCNYINCTTISNNIFNEVQKDGSLITDETVPLSFSGAVVFDSLIDDASPQLGGDLDTNGHDIKLNTTTNPDNEGIIYKGDNPFLHDFNYGDNGTVTTTGNNIFIGRNSGNYTMGATATGIWESSSNVGIGRYALESTTTGYQNTAIGYNTLPEMTEGSDNVAVGCSANGVGVAISDNTAVGSSSLRYNITGEQNTAIGRYAIAAIADGSLNTSLGYKAGMTNAVDNNTITNKCVVIGASTKTLTDDTTNEVVIGAEATGYGSDTVTLGNNDIITTHLKGAVNMKEIATPADPEIDSFVIYMEAGSVKIKKNVGGVVTESTIF